MSYKIPSTEIMQSSKTPEKAYNEETEDHIPKKLEEAFKNFDIQIEVTGKKDGPVVTRYEIKPGKGVKSSQIKSIEDDLCIAIGINDINILTPIPGTARIGIEVPNQNRQIIPFKELK